MSRRELSASHWACSDSVDNNSKHGSVSRRIMVDKLRKSKWVTLRKISVDQSHHRQC